MEDLRKNLRKLLRNLGRARMRLAQCDNLLAAGGKHAANLLKGAYRRIELANHQHVGVVTFHLPQHAWKVVTHLRLQLNSKRMGKIPYE